MGFTLFVSLDSRRSERESSTASYDGASPSPLVDIPVHVRDIVLKKAGARAAAAIACTCKELRDDGEIIRSGRLGILRYGRVM